MAYKEVDSEEVLFMKANLDDDIILQIILLEFEDIVLSFGDVFSYKQTIIHM